MTCVCGCTMIEINLGDIELQKNVLKFGHRINYKYKGTISHSFDRFYVVTKFEQAKVQDLPFTTIPYDKGCNHLDDAKSKGRYPLSLIQDVKDYCVKITSHIAYYKKQLKYYNQTAHEILTNELALILSTFTRQEKQKRGIPTSIITGFNGLAYEGISTFLHYKRQKTLHKAVHALENKVDIQCNKIFHLEDSLVMYGIYNSDTLDDLIDTVHRLHNKSTWDERLFAGQIKDWYLSAKGVNHYAINSLLFLTAVREKYVKMYERFINHLKEYSQVIRILSKGYLPISLLPPSKLSTILEKVKEALQINNRDYDLVIKRLYFYYDMKLVTFGIDDQRNLIIHFPGFVHLHTQQHLILYQMETVPLPIVDENEQAQSYTYLQVKKQYVALNSETYISLRMQELNTCKKIGYEFYCEELFVVRHKTKHSCESAIYFDLGMDIIKENCDFQYYFNNTDVNPSVLDGGHEIILANWPNTEYVICNDNHNFPIKIPSHPYVLLKRTVLCNCGIEAENNFLLESIAACPGN